MDWNQFDFDRENSRLDQSRDGIGADKLREECGVFGIYDLDGNDVASTVYYGLLPCSTGDRKAAALRSAIQRDQRAR